MQSADDFINAVESAGVLNATEAAELRRAAAEGKTPVALAAELVNRGALTSDEASNYLSSSSDASVQMSASDLLMPGSSSSVGDDSLSGWRSSDDVAGGASNVLDSRVDLPSPTAKAPPAEESVVKYDKDYEDTLNESMHGSADGPKPSGGKRRKHLKKAKSNEFDSPLILLGGGGLVLLVLCGLGLAFLLNQESGDELLQTARTSYESGSFSQAITAYERFIEDFSSHAGWSGARVQLATARIRQAVETGRDEAEGLRLAKREIPAIEDEPAFDDAHGEFASLLPKIAMGLAEDADAASREDRLDEVDALVTQVNDTLTLVGNTKYVPKSLRDEGELDTIRELLVRIERRREASQDLRDTLAAMASATDGGDPRAAYEAHRELLDKRPEVADDERLTEAIRAAGEAERSAIRFVGDRVAAETDERPSPIVTSVLVADRRVEGTVEAGGVFVAVGDGVAYAVRASDGLPLWRRPLGVSLTSIDPTPLDGGVLLADHRHQELVFLDAESGDLRWRAPLGSAMHRPLVLGGRVLVALESGKLVSLDATSGERLGHAEFAQPLRSPPAADRGGERIYLAGEHSSLYTLDAASLECVEVTYLGHSPGAIAAAPTVAVGRLLVLENVGLDTCQLRLFQLRADGGVGEEAAPLRLDGACESAPLVAGRRVMIATRKGEVKLLELTDDPAAPPTVLATRPVGRQKPGPRFLASAADSFWIADVGLTRSAASLADSRLLVQRLEQPFAADPFIGPLVSNGEALLHSRRRKGRPGVTLAATDVGTGDAAWEVDFGAPPLAAPAPSAKLRGLVVTTTLGAVHLVDRDAVRLGASVKPAAEADAKGAFDGSATLGDGTRVLTRTGDADFVTVRMAANRPARRGRLADELACRPAPMGPGWLAPLEVGQVLLIGATGRDAATPFQPPLVPGRKVRWRTPAVSVIRGEELAVIADDVDAVYCLALAEGDRGASLDERGSHRLAGAQPLTGVAIAGDRAAVGVSGDRLAVFDLPDLGEPQLTPLGGPIAWGPHAAGDAFVASTASGELSIVGDSTQRIALPVGTPLGEPVVSDGRMTIVLDSGAVVSYDLQTGELVAEASLGQTVGSGPTPYGPRLLVGAADASILVIQLP